MKTIEKVSQEIQTAKDKYGPFNSSHELYGVLAEELEEFFELVRQKPYTKKDEEREAKERDMKKELIQIAAIALRGVSEIEHNEIRWV